MKTQIVSKDTIKPSSTTPKSFTLSLLDQVSPPVYTKLFFFYPNTSPDSVEEVTAERIRCLKSSLSEVLTIFYPFAGTIKDQTTVTLGNDDGAEFIEARVDCTLSEYLKSPKAEQLAQLVPTDFWDGCTRPLLHVQASFFTCGGLGIGINFAHKVSDAATFTSFVNAWADTAIGKIDTIPSPDFSASLVFPSMEGQLWTGAGLDELVQLKTQTRRFVFTAPMITALQEKAKAGGVHRPSRMETVSTFIWRSGMKMASSLEGGKSRPSVLITPVNIRRKLPPPVCDQSFGNMVETLVVPTHGNETELSYLISVLREKILESRESYDKEMLQGEESLAKFLEIANKMKELMLTPEEMNCFTVTSWSKFPFYEADFGWGKPVWVATHYPIPYITVLMDTPDGTGIEAWVSYGEKQMTAFENNEELLAYATPDPSAL